MHIYIHVPFCVRKCRYCSFYSKVPSTGEMEAYVKHILREIQFWGERLGRIPVNTIFFGGGTPSLLASSSIEAILNQLATFFSINADHEISLEANPDSILRPSMFSDLLHCGINRLSIGIQSLNDDFLHVLGRPHDSSQAIKAVTGAHAAGFTNVSVDLIWAIPGQKLKNWLEELKYICLHLKPEHLSCYGLTLEPETELALDCARGVLTMPPDSRQAIMFMRGAEFLEEKGYLHYEVSNFAKMGYLCRHNIGYWEGQDYLGFGPSAVSTWLGRRWTNPPDMQHYFAAINTGRIGDNAEILDPRARLSELIMLRLRTSRGLRLKAYEELTGHSFFEDHQPLVNLLHTKGLIRISNGYLRLTRNGMLVSNSIVSRIFADTPALSGTSPMTPLPRV